MAADRKPDVIVKVGKVEIGLARPRLRETMFLDILSSKMPEVTGIPWLYQYGWCKTISRTLYTKGLKYTLPTSASTEAEVRAAYQSFLDLDDAITEKWGDGIRQLEAPGTPLHERPLKDVPKDLQTDPNFSSGARRTRTKSSAS